MWNLSADLYRRYSARFGEEIFSQGHVWLRDKGYLIRREFLNDLAGYDILRLFDDWPHPTLFVNSGSDTIGERWLAESACQKIGSRGTRMVIKGANHSFTCQPELEESAAQVSAEWVRDLVRKPAHLGPS